MFRRVPTRRLRAATLIALAALAVAAPSAHAHAAFLGATPPPGARVETAPAAITLRFTETLNRHLSDAHLVDAARGRRVPAVVPEQLPRLSAGPSSPSGNELSMGERTPAESGAEASGDVTTGSIGPDGGLVLWNVETGEGNDLSGGHKLDVVELALSRDGKTLVSLSGDRTLRTWDTA